MNIRKFGTTLIAFSFTAMFSWGAFWADAQVRAPMKPTKSDGKVKDADMKQRIVTAVSQPEVANYLGTRLDTDWSSNEYGELFLGNEDATHPQGIFRAEGGSVVVWPDNPQNPLNFALFKEKSTLRVIEPDASQLSQAELLKQATKFSQELFPKFFSAKNLPLPQADGPNNLGEVSVEWQRYDAEGLPNESVRVVLRRIDGKVLSFASSHFVGEWPHKITPAQAKQAALASVQNNKAWSDIKIIRLNLSGANGKALYAIELKAFDKTTSRTGTAMAYVDALTGQSSQPAWEYVADNLASSVLYNDRLPVWTAQGLVFSSQREIQSAPEWTRLPEQLMIRQENGQLFHLTADYEPDQFKSLNGAASWLAMIWHGWSYALNLKNGEYRVLSNPKRYLNTPAVRPDGAWSVAAGMAATGNAGSDLMPDALQREPAMALRGRLLIPNSDETDPVFSPDGQWLYFIKSKDEGEVLSLHRIPALIVETRERLAVKDEQQQAIIEKLPFPVERLSVTRDGKHLVAQLPLQYLLPHNDLKKPAEIVNLTSHIAVIDIETKKLRELKLPSLKDTEIGSASIEELQDAWAGPGNDEVTFSGKTIDADKKERRRIYSCRFDGSNLRAWTPKENQPVPAYQFPETQKTAYELAKEIALGELEFNDKEKTARR